MQREDNVATARTITWPAAVILFSSIALSGCASVLDQFTVTDSDGATGSAVSYMDNARRSNGL